MKSKTILVFPGSNWQIPLIEKSKVLGYRTLVVNPYAESPAFPYADGHLQSDIFDIERVANYCKSENIDAIVTDECDIAMPVLADLGKRMGLATLDTESAHLFTDKYAMCEFAKGIGIPVPEYRLCQTIAEAEAFLKEMGGEIIIKPLDSNSSRGVFSISNKTDLERYFTEAMNFSKIQEAVLAERYIEGTEFTIDGIKTPERHFTLAISEKKHFLHNKNIACELYFSHKNQKFDYELLAEQNDRFVNTSSLEFGLTHAEYKYENGKFYLIEIGARGGGNFISSHIVPFMSGADNYSYLIDCSLGNIKCLDFTIPADRKNHCAALRFFDTPSSGGIVKSIHGEEILSDHPCVINYKFNFAIGDCIDRATTDANRAGYYIACCEKKEELDKLMKTIAEKVYIVCE